MNENDSIVPVSSMPQALERIHPQTSITSIEAMEQAFAAAVRQRELIHDYIKKNLHPEKHFYTVRKDGKPSLSKEGAELIMLPHGLVPDYELVSGPDRPPADGMPYQITVKCTLRSKGLADSFAGSGLGSASSHNTTREGKRQPRQNDPGLCHNATTKMAQKSAMIAAVLNSTAASEFFTQDIEDDVTVAPPPSGGRQTRPPTPMEGRDHRVKPPSPSASPAPANQKPSEDFLAKCKARFLERTKPLIVPTWIWAVNTGRILPTEQLDAISVNRVPTTAEEFQKITEEIDAIISSNAHMDGDWQMKFEKAHDDIPFEVPAEDKPAPAPDQGRPDDWWRDVKVPPYKDNSSTLGELPKNKIFGYWANFKAEPRTWKGKRYEVTPDDLLLREALDAAGEHYDFKLS